MSAFDVSKLTLGEIAKVEELSGVAVGLIEAVDVPKGRLFSALAFVIKRREDPTYTLAKAEALTLDEATALIGGDDDEAGDDDAAPIGNPLDSDPKALPSSHVS